MVLPSTGYYILHPISHPSRQIVQTGAIVAWQYEGNQQLVEFEVDTTGKYPCLILLVSSNCMI